MYWTATPNVVLPPGRYEVIDQVCDGVEDRLDDGKSRDLAGGVAGDDDTELEGDVNEVFEHARGVERLVGGAAEDADPFAVVAAAPEFRHDRVAP